MVLPYVLDWSEKVVSKYPRVKRLLITIVIFAVAAKMLKDWVFDQSYIILDGLMSRGMSPVSIPATDFSLYIAFTLYLSTKTVLMDRLVATARSIFFAGSNFFMTIVEGTAPTTSLTKMGYSSATRTFTSSSVMRRHHLWYKISPRMDRSLVKSRSGVSAGPRSLLKPFCQQNEKIVTIGNAI